MKSFVSLFISINLLFAPYAGANHLQGIENTKCNQNLCPNTCSQSPSRDEVLLGVMMLAVFVVLPTAAVYAIGVKTQEDCVEDYIRDCCHSKGCCVFPNLFCYNSGDYYCSSSCVDGCRELMSQDGLCPLNAPIYTAAITSGLVMTGGLLWLGSRVYKSYKNQQVENIIEQPYELNLTPRSGSATEMSDLDSLDAA